MADNSTAQLAVSNIHADSFTFDQKFLLDPLKDISIIRKLFPIISLSGAEQMKAHYFEATNMNLPQMVRDLKNPEVNDLTTQEKIIEVHEIVDALNWTKRDFNRISKDVSNINHREGLLGERFGEKENITGIAGHTSPAITALLNASRGEDAALTNKTATTFAGWAAMIAELRSDMRNDLGTIYQQLVSKQWLLMSTDVYDLATQTYSTTQDNLSVLNWLQMPVAAGGAGFGDNIWYSNHLGATVTNNVSAENGTQNIMLGTNSLLTGALYVTPFQKLDASRHDQEVRWWYSQRFAPACFRSTGFQWEDGVTVS